MKLVIQTLCRVTTPDTNFEFSSRSIVSVLFPNFGGAFRAPGIEAYGDLAGGHAQYWVGAFNGQGILESGTTNEPEIVGRLRFSPWKQSIHTGLKGFALGGSIDHSRSKGLAGELSFSGLMTDGTYNFFPQFRINGGIERYNGFFIWLRGPLGVRGEYTQILEKRDGIGSFAPDGVGFNSLPGVAILSTINDVGGADEGWYNPGDGKYYLGAGNMIPGPVLGIIDAGSRQWLQNLPTTGFSHSVAADPNNNHVYVPLGASPLCQSQAANGCVGVYASQ